MNPFGENKRKRKWFGLNVGAVAIVALVLAACGGVVGTSIGDSNSIINHQANVSNNAIGRIQCPTCAEPLPVLSDSADAHNQRIFYTEQSDPNKLEYLELIGLDGSPIAHYTIKGQVSSMNTQLSNPSQMTCQYSSDNNSAAYGCAPIGLPEPNGVYQGNDNGHFAITTSGALIEWEGNFITSDQPFTVKSSEKIVLNESVAPTVTNTSAVSAGALLPNGRTH